MLPSSLVFQQNTDLETSAGDASYEQMVTEHHHEFSEGVEEGPSNNQTPGNGDNNEVLYWYDSSPASRLGSVEMIAHESGVLGKRRQVEDASLDLHHPNPICPPRLQSGTASSDAAGSQQPLQDLDSERQKRRRLSSVDWPMARDDEASTTYNPIENRDWTTVTVKEELVPPEEEAEF
mmetsp:Transcript_26810/g.36938  ORF Transcript_26810/g.36938 Transcript_26810/m.36938 type:complete len:178 (+) Transcript_26810:1097-1630(+)